MKVAQAAFARGPRFDGFISLLSAAALDRFGEEWRRAILEWHGLETLTDEQIVT